MKLNSDSGAIPMRAPNFSRSAIIDRDAFRGPLVIAIGLGVLLVASWLPAVPVISSMALLAVGATSVTLARFRGTSALLPVMLVHSATYGGLYVLYFGATLHKAATGDASGLGLFQAADMTASILLMGIVFARTLSDLRPKVARRQ
jgi:hypothetical protein